MLGIRLVGSGGMLPQEKFMKIWCCWMASGAILGLKHLCFNLAIISNRIHFMTTRMEIGVYRHQQFQVHLLNWAKKRHTKPVNILLRWILFHWALGWNDWGVTGRGSHSFLWHPHKLCGPWTLGAIDSLRTTGIACMIIYFKNFNNTKQYSKIQVNVCEVNSILFAVNNTKQYSKIEINICEENSILFVVLTIPSLWYLFT